MPPGSSNNRRGDTPDDTTTTGDDNSSSSSATMITTTVATTRNNTNNNNMRRCHEMLQYQNEIVALQTKLQTLKQQQEAKGRLAALQTCQNPEMAAYLWSQLRKQERWKKDFVLALLHCDGYPRKNTNSTSTMTQISSGDGGSSSRSSNSRIHTEKTRTFLPVPLRLHKWDQKVPRHLRNDRDIVLTRLQRHDLFHGIPSKSTTPTTSTPLLTIPALLQKDLTVVLATIRRYPDVLLLHVPPQSSSSRKPAHQQQHSLLELHADSHVEIFQTLLEAFRHDDHGNNTSCNTGDGLSMLTSMTRLEFWNHFSSLVIRDNPNIMMQVWQDWVVPGHVHVSESLFGPVLQNDKTFALQLASASAATAAVAAASAAATMTNDNNNNSHDNTTYTCTSTTTFPANSPCALYKKTLQADPDVILAYCACNGENFLHISNGLQYSWQVIKTASLQNPSIVLRNLTMSTKKRLRWTKTFLLQLFDRLVEINNHSRHCYTCCCCHHENDTTSTTVGTVDETAALAAKVVWEYCSPKLRQDRQVIIAALRAGAKLQYILQSLSSSSSDLTAAETTTSTTMTTMTKGNNNNNIKSSKNNKQRHGPRRNNHTATSTTLTIPSFLLYNRDLWLDLICSGHLSWNELPRKLKRDKEFAIACLLYHENYDNAINDNIIIHSETINHDQQQSHRRRQLRQNNNNSEPLSMEMVQTILEHCPHVVTDPRMVVAWIQHYHGAVCSCSSLSNFFYTTSTPTPVVMSCRVVCPCLDMHLETLPLSTRQNKSYMLRACRVNAAVILYLPVTLREDRDIVSCVLTSSSRGQRPLASLQYVSAMAQHLYPDLVAQAIRQLPKPPSFTDNDEINGFYNDPKGKKWSIWDVYDDVDENLWVNREIALAWVERGGAYLHDDFPESFENDAELFLEIAASPRNWDDFMFASETLLSDKDFMTKAVQRNGRVLKEANNGLDKDFDLALIAFAHTENLVNNYNWKCPEALVSAGASTSIARGAGSSGKNVGGDFVFLVDFAKHVRTELMCHESFIEFILCIQLSRPTATPATTTNTNNVTTSASPDSKNNNSRSKGNGGNRGRGGGGGGGGVRGKDRHRGNKHEQTAVSPPSGDGNNIHLLAQGRETTLGFTKLVAAYMGIPTGERLHLLRRASTNLARWGF